MSSALFVISYASILLLPGIALDRLIFRDRSLGVLAWLAISYSLFVLVFLISNYYAVPAQYFGVCIFALLAVSLVSFLAKTPRRIDNLTLADKTKNRFIPILSITAVSLVYQLIFGVFTEVPADIYAHLERYQFARANLSNGNLGQALDAKNLLLQKSGVFYYLIAFSNSMAQLETKSLLALVDFVNRTLFLLTVFFFARVIFKETVKQDTAAYLATAFTAFHMGINVFAFTRYYSFAPTMLAMTLYFFAIALFLKQIYSTFHIGTSVRNLGLIFVAITSAAAVHTQEALFVGVMIACISIISCFSRFRVLGVSNVSQYRLTILASVAAVISFVFLYRYSLDNFSRAPNAHWKLWDFGEGPWFLPQLTILNLKFQFMRVVTLWGLLVYVLFFLNIKRYRNNIFILAGMLSPLATFLNPFFIDTFLRHYNSTTIWRLCYLLPIHFVAADLFIYYARKLKEKQLVKRIPAGAIVVTLIGLLMPLKNTWSEAHYSRWPTLKASDPNLSHQNYSDIIDYLDSLNTTEMILTDPMTGYMVSGLTKHKSPRKKFFRDYKFKHFSFNDYENKPLDQYSNHLLIVNLRPRDESSIGAQAKHWRKSEWLKTRSYYPQQLLEHLQSRPERFEKLWVQRDIMIYRIAEKKNDKTVQ